MELDYIQAAHATGTPKPMVRTRTHLHRHTAFGRGERRCPGRDMSVYLVKSIVALMFAGYHLDIVHAGAEQPKDLYAEHNLKFFPVLRPRKEIEVIITPR